MISNAGWLVFEKLIRIVQGILVGAAVARYLQPERFGVLSLGLTIVGIATMLSELSLEKILVKYYATNEWNKEKLLSQAWKTTSIFGLILFATTILSSQFIEFKSLKYTIVVLSFGLLEQTSFIYRVPFTASLQSKKLVILDLLVSLVFAVFQIYLILQKADLVFFALVYVLSKMVTGASIYLLYRSTFKDANVSERNIISIQRLIRESFPILSAALIAYLYTKVDRVMVGYISGIEELGFYSVAGRIYEYSWIIPTSLIQSVQPKIAIEASREEGFNHELFKKICSSLAFIGILMNILFLVSSQLIITLLYGEEYRRSIVILIILSFSLLPLCIGRLRNFIWIAHGFQKYLIYVNIAGLITNFVLNLILIPKYGGAGAALATVVSITIQMWLSTYFLKSTRVVGKLQTESVVIALSPSFLLKINDHIRLILREKVNF